MIIFGLRKKKIVTQKGKRWIVKLFLYDDVPVCQKLPEALHTQSGNFSDRPLSSVIIFLTLFFFFSFFFFFFCPVDLRLSQPSNDDRYTLSASPTYSMLASVLFVEGLALRELSSTSSWCSLNLLCYCHVDYYSSVFELTGQGLTAERGI